MALLTTVERVRLVERLQGLEQVTRFDRPNEPQSETLVHSLTDLEESFRKVLEVVLPKLLDASLEKTQLLDVLHELGEEYRHILYHIRDPAFFAYLNDD